MPTFDCSKPETQLTGVEIAVGAATGSYMCAQPTFCSTGSVSLEEEENFGGSFEEQVLVSYALDHHVPEEMSLVPEVYAGAVGCVSLSLSLRFSGSVCVCVCQCVSVASEVGTRA